MRNISNTHAEFIDYNNFISPRKVIYYVGGACSSGKTHQTCSYVEEHCQETNFLIVCPSTRLGEQTAAELRRRGLVVHSINTSTHPRQVRRHIIEEMKEAPEAGLVMVVTWQAYVDLPYVPGEKNFQVIIDEVPQLDEFHPLRLLPESVNHITDWVEVVGSVNERVGVVEARDERKLQRYLEKQGDDVKDLFIRLLRDVASPNKVVYVDLRSWN